MAPFPNSSVSSGIDTTVPESFFLVNDSNNVHFQEECNETTYFAEIKGNLVDAMASTSGIQEIPEGLPIVIKAGFQSPQTTCGFSARHIIARGHTKEMHERYKASSSSHCQSLIKFIRFALENINVLNDNTEEDMILRWAPQNKAYIFALDTKIQFGKLQHVLMTFYGKKRLTIGTIYLIDLPKFNYIREGNAWYCPVLPKIPLQTSFLTPVIIEEIEEETILKPISNEPTSSPESFDAYDFIRNKLSDKIELFDEGLTYFELIEKGCMEIDGEVHQLVNDDLQQEINRQIKSYKKEMSAYSQMTQKIDDHIEMVKIMSKYCIEFNIEFSKLTQHVQQLSKTIDELKLSAETSVLSEKFALLDAIFKKGMLHLFEPFLEKHEKAYETFTKSYQTLEIQLASKSTVTKRLAAPIALGNMPLTNKMTRQEIEDEDILQKLKSCNLLITQLETMSDSEYDDFQKQVSEAIENFAKTKTNDPRMKQLFELIIQFNQTYIAKKSKEHELKKCFDTMTVFQNKIYLSALNAANYYLKFALGNKLQNIDDYDGSSYFTFKLKELEPEFKTICQTQKEKEGLDYFERNLEKFCLVYGFKISIENQHSELKEFKY